MLGGLGGGGEPDIGGEGKEAVVGNSKAFDELGSSTSLDRSVPNLSLVKGGEGKGLCCKDMRCIENSCDDNPDQVE